MIGSVYNTVSENILSTKAEFMRDKWPNKLAVTPNVFLTAVWVRVGRCTSNTLIDSLCFCESNFFFCPINHRAMSYHLCSQLYLTWSSLKWEWNTALNREGNRWSSGTFCPDVVNSRVDGTENSAHKESRNISSIHTRFPSPHGRNNSSKINMNYHHSSQWDVDFWSLSAEFNFFYFWSV